jgi:hypothetical protein
MGESFEGAVLASFRKNSLEEIRVSLLENRGYHFIDLRIFSSPQRGEEKESTSSGITLPISLFSELKSAILEAEKKLNQKELF